jgi:bacterioferritin (cytochrome b1)
MLALYEQVGDTMAKQVLDDLETASNAAQRILDLQDDLAKLQEREKYIKERLAKYQQKKIGISEPVKNLGNEKFALLKKVDAKVLEKCFKYLNKESDEDIAFIMEKLVGLFLGSENATPSDVKAHMEKLDRLNQGFTDFDFTKFTIAYYKNLLHELFGKRAKNLGIVKETTDGKYVATGIEFPQKQKEFLIFYRILILMCKFSIAKQDEEQVLKAI